MNWTALIAVLSAAVGAALAWFLRRPQNDKVEQDIGKAGETVKESTQAATSAQASAEAHEAAATDAAKAAIADQQDPATSVEGAVERWNK